MAMEAKEGAHRRGKSCSTPSSPRNIKATHGRQMSVDSHTDIELPTSQKPLPNYLKPTISSIQNICSCPSKQAASEAPANAAKYLLRRRSIDKLPSPSYQPQRASASNPSSPKEKTAKTSPPLPKSPRLIRDKALESHPSSKVIRIQKKKIETNGNKIPEEKVLSIDDGSIPQDVHPLGIEPKTTRSSHSSPRSGQQLRSMKRASMVARDDEVMIDGEEQYEGSGESLAGGEKGGTGRLRARRLRSLRAEDPGSDGGARRLKFRQVRKEGKGKESSPTEASNEVIEEAASKLAENRRSKVAALVGAFETVISLQEQDPIAPQPQQQVVATAEAGKGIDWDGGGVAAEEEAAAAKGGGGGDVVMEVVVEAGEGEDGGAMTAAEEEGSRNKAEESAKPVDGTAAGSVESG